MRRVWLAVLAAALLSGAPAAQADVWDTQTTNDNGPTYPGFTGNTLIHGTHQQHDLPAQASTFTCAGPACADEDWYFVWHQTRSSFEVVVDAISGDAAPGLDVDLTDWYYGPLATGTGIDGSPTSRSLRFDTGTADPYTGDPNFFGYVVVSGASCGTGCGPDDVYHIRSYDTTYTIPRFNNSSSQVTVLMIQNTSGDTVNVNIDFFGATGTVLGTENRVLAPKSLAVINTSALAYANSTAGSIKVRHDGRYGSLAGKAVAVEPATGFTFDTLMVFRPV